MNKRINAGFTLIELMAAMTIMSVGLFAIVHMAAVSTRGIAYARELSNASLLAQAVAQELSLRSSQWSDISQEFETQLGKIAIVSDEPLEPGTFIDPDALTPLTTLFGKQIVKDKESTNIDDAYKINLWGNTPYDGSDDGLLDEGALYQVYLVAWPISVANTVNGIKPNSLQVQIYVMWDNKDHGKQYSWNGVSSQDFWNRHWVYSEVTLIPNQNVILGGAT